MSRYVAPDRLSLPYDRTDAGSEVEIEKSEYEQDAQVDEFFHQEAQGVSGADAGRGDVAHGAARTWSFRIRVVGIKEESRFVDGIQRAWIVARLSGRDGCGRCERPSWSTRGAYALAAPAAYQYHMGDSRPWQQFRYF